MINITKLINENTGKFSHNYWQAYNSFSGCDVVVSAQMAPIPDPNNNYELTPFKSHVLGSLQTISYSTHQDRAPVRAIGNINAIDYVQGQRTIAGTMVFAMFHEHWMTPLLEDLKTRIPNLDIWSDELPALNLTISMSNEYGYASNMVIYGVKFIEDGGVMSINDLYTENTLQYVATGIQPLKTNGQFQHENGLELRTDKIIGSRPTSPYVRKDEESPTAYYVHGDIRKLPPGQIKNGYKFEDTPFREPIINKPIDSEGNGFVHFREPEDSEDKYLNLHLINTDNGKKYQANKTAKNIWTTAVPSGIYYLIYDDEYGNKIICTELINMESEKNKKTDLSYPVIAEIGSTSVTVLPNDLNHDYLSLSEVSYVDYETITGIIPEEVIREAVLYKIENNTSVGRSNSKEIVIEYLKPNTEYVLQTVNSIDTQDCSATVRFKTFISQQEKYDILKNYITVNKSLLVNREKVLSFDYDSLKYENSNIIDAVLQCNSFNDNDIKTEILFYATKLQNEFNYLYNDYGISNSINKNKLTPLINKFDIDSSVQSIIIYKRIKNKDYFVTRSNAFNDYQYTGKEGIRYYIQPILNNNCKGNYIDFICYNDNQKKLLSPYTNTNNLTNVSFVNKNMYENKYKKDLLLAIKAAENLNIYKNFLDMPYANFEDKTLIVDTDYAIMDDSIFYLCIALPEDALEYTPIRKIPFDKENKKMEIALYYSGMLKDKYYLIWIQDKNFNNISEPFIVSTYFNDDQIVKYYNNKCIDYIKNIKNSFSPDSSYRHYIDLLYSELVAIEELKYKDIDLFILQTFLYMFDVGLNERMDNLLNMILDHIYMHNYHFDAKAIIKQNIITFSSNSSHHITAIHITADNIKKETYIEYDINQQHKGYTLLYASNSHSNLTSGYILIDNVTKKIYTSNIIVGGITNGWLL